MKLGSTLPRLVLAAVFAASAFTAFAADPVPPQIKNLVSKQRPGTMFVDITYDLVDPDSEKVVVAMEASADGGAIYNIPTLNAMGDIGWVVPGTSRKIVWNAWNDWAGNYTTNAKVRLIADDTGSLRAPPPFPAPSPNLVWIAPGAFNMSGQNVYLSKGFWVSKYEVSRNEFGAIIPGVPGYGFGGTGYNGSGSVSVGVTWNEATNYCAELTQTETIAGRLPNGWRFRLPTEAEWEYVCRAGTTTLYSFGDDPTNGRLAAHAWFFENLTIPGNHGLVHTPGTRMPNRWGVYDMHGNAEEWCLDWYGDRPNQSLTDPTGPNAGSEHVTRGGRFDDSAELCTSSSRRTGAPSPGMGGPMLGGIRIVLSQ